MPSFEAQELTKSYGGRRGAVPALADVSFRYDHAGAVGYLGPNGAGKTTTLKLFVGLLNPTRGTALLNDVDILESRKQALWDVGTVIETPEPYATQTIDEALRMVGRFRGIGSESLRDQVLGLSEELDLPPLGTRNGALSKGQRQRVVLAAAVLGDPRVLLLDEPASGLDPAERRVVRNLLLRLKRDHLILMNSHHMRDVAQICDELIILDRGHVRLRDRVDGVLSRLRTREIEVAFSHPVDRDRFDALRPPLQEVEALSDRRFRLFFDGSDEVRHEMLIGVQRIGTVLSFANAGLPLEEAYLQLLAPAE